MPKNNKINVSIKNKVRIEFVLHYFNYEPLVLTIAFLLVAY